MNWCHVRALTHDVTSNTERLGGYGEDSVVKTNYRDLVEHQNDFVDDCNGQ